MRPHLWRNRKHDGRTDQQHSRTRRGHRCHAPTLRDNGSEADDRRRLPDANIELLDTTGVFAMAVPARFGGLDLPLADLVAVLQETARGCGSTGWTAATRVSTTWMITLYPDRAQQEVFARRSVRVSGGFTPSGTLTPTEGGYLLSGSWRFNTGCGPPAGPLSQPCGFFSTSVSAEML
ncbi:acyl-CoA dehydrogenase family protein [Streptomyces cyaneofuscatus]|uniref:acyl-CoA dehydrogenase family protein n=1 Tax=Streptomyces cyaneofuscatus TaxID=66883 RepID=UPI003666874B